MQNSGISKISLYTVVPYWHHSIKEVNKMSVSRISARVSNETKELVHDAARIEGVTVANFLKSAAVDEAHRIINRERTVMVSAKHADAFFAALETAPKPNKALLNAAKNSRV